MATIQQFPGCATPAEISAASADVLKAIDLLHQVRAHTARPAMASEAEHELLILGRAIAALCRGRPIYCDRPDADAIALIDEALVLAELCGLALNQLARPRRTLVLPVVLEALHDAADNGPEAAQFPIPTEIPRPLDPQA